MQITEKTNTILRKPKEQKNSSIKRNLLPGSLCGITTLLAKSSIDRFVLYPQIARELMQEYRIPLTLDQVDELNTVSNFILRSSGLADKSVQILNHNTMGIYNGEDRIPRFLRNLPIGNAIGNNIQRKKRAALDSIARGMTAAYNGKTNRILANVDIQTPGIIHEIGHAYNKNNSLLWGLIQKYGCKLSKIIPSGIILYTLFTENEENKNGKELTKKQKAKNFVRDNSFLLVFASTVPKLLEEARASRVGYSLSKDFLSENLLRRVKTMNKIGIHSYLISALSLTITAFIAKTLKDALKKSYEEENTSKTPIKEISNLNNTIKLNNNTNGIFSNFNKFQ